MNSIIQHIKITKFGNSADQKKQISIQRLYINAFKEFDMLKSILREFKTQFSDFFSEYQDFTLFSTFQLLITTIQRIYN